MAPISGFRYSAAMSLGTFDARRVSIFLLHGFYITVADHLDRTAICQTTPQLDSAPPSSVMPLVRGGSLLARSTTVGPRASRLTLCRLRSGPGDKGRR